VGPTLRLNLAEKRKTSCTCRDSDLGSSSPKHSHYTDHSNLVSMNLHNGQSPINIAANMTYSFETNNEENAVVFSDAMVRWSGKYVCTMLHVWPGKYAPCFMFGPVNMHHVSCLAR